jgi:hypothetical protein
MADLALTSPPVDVLAQRKAAPNVADVKTREQARAVAQEFERMFVTEMLQPMFSGIESEAPFGGGQGEDVFRPMLLDQYADAVAKGGGIGIAAEGNPSPAGARMTSQPDANERADQLLAIRRLITCTAEIEAMNARARRRFGRLG